MSDYFSVSNPQDLVVRPLSGGMRGDVVSIQAPEGSFLAINGFNVTTKGLTRAGGWHPSMRDSSGFSLVVPWELPAENERAEDMVQVEFADGTSKVLLVSSRFLYEVSIENGYTPIFFQAAQTVATWTAGTDGELTVTGVDLEALDVVAGDYVWMTKGGATEKVPIQTVSVAGGDTTITLTGTFTLLTPATSDSFRILKPFAAGDEWFVDFTLARNSLYLVDTSSPYVFKYTYLGYLETIRMVNSSAARTMFGARTIAYFGDRLFFGDVREPDGAGSQFFYHQRIRWTTVASLEVSESAYYQDLPLARTSIIKLSGLGSLLTAHTYDAVYWGRPTQRTDIPYAFSMIDTGGISAVGMKAVAGFVAGQIYVGRDDVYALDPNGGVTSVGEGIARQSILIAQNTWNTYAVSDPESYRLTVGICKGGTALDILFFLNMKTGKWSFYEDPAWAYQCLSAFQLLDELTYEEAEAETWTYEVSPYVYTSYYELSYISRVRQFYAITDSSHLIAHDPSADRHYFPNALAADTELPILGQLETPDFDFGSSDANKTVLRLGLGIEEDQSLDPRTNRIVFLTEWSYDKGRSWNRVGNLTFNVDDEEDGINFRATASAMRFRLTLDTSALATDNQVEPFTVAELAVRVRTRGAQAHGLISRPAV